MTGSDQLRAGQYAQEAVGRDTLIKISNVYDTRVTAQVLWEDGGPLQRTRVRTYVAAQAEHFVVPASAALVDLYEQAMGWSER